MKPFRHATELLAVIPIIIASHAGAQSVNSPSTVNAAIDRWSREKGVVVTKDVREQLARNLAIEFATGGPEIGLDPADAWRLGGAIAAGGTVESTSKGKAVVMTGRSGSGKFVASARRSPLDESELAPDFSEYHVAHENWGGANSVFKSRSQILVGLGTVFNFLNIGKILQIYPQLHLAVQPVPPRDYSVKINGGIYEATEMALYGVSPDVLIMVRIERAGKACEWSGLVSTGHVVEVKCTL
jgi:hypothetical protein